MSTYMGGATAVQRDGQVEEINVLGRYLQQQLDRLDWSPERLATELGKDSAYVGKLMSGKIVMPTPTTIRALSWALRVPEREMLLHAAKSAGMQVELDSAPVPTDDQLIYELARRLRECTPVIEPMEIPRDSVAFTQLTELRAEIDTAEQAARSATPVQEWRVRGWEHIGAYLDALIVRGDASPATDS